MREREREREREFLFVSKKSAVNCVDIPSNSLRFCFVKSERKLTDLGFYLQYIFIRQQGVFGSANSDRSYKYLISVIKEMTPAFPCPEQVNLGTKHSDAAITSRAKWNPTKYLSNIHRKETRSNYMKSVFILGEN